MPRKTIVCLANSKKLGDRCVAGFEIDSQQWIRPIGSGSHGAVTAAEQTLDDGTLPGILDLISLPRVVARSHITIWRTMLGGADDELARDGVSVSVGLVAAIADVTERLRRESDPDAQGAGALD